MIDDEQRETNSYVDELRFSGYQVQFERDTDRAIQYLKDHLAEIELLILDIMMPPGRVLANADTRNGLRTGVHLLALIREMTETLPVLVLTNVSDQGVEEKLSRMAHCRFLRKEDFYPFELVDEVKSFLGTSGANR